jgi:hypothetical protein
MRHLTFLTAAALAVLPATAASAYPGGPEQPLTGQRDQRFAERWQTLSSFTPARQGRETVTLTGRDRKIDRIRIEAARGAPKIRRVIVQYANREVEQKPVNMRLARGQQQIIELDRNRRVTRITVETDPRFGGEYSLYGG